MSWIYWETAEFADGLNYPQAVLHFCMADTAAKKLGNVSEGISYARSCAKGAKELTQCVLGSIEFV